MKTLITDAFDGEHPDDLDAELREAVRMEEIMNLYKMWEA